MCKRLFFLALCGAQSIVILAVWLATHQPPALGYNYDTFLVPSSPLYAGAPFINDKGFWSWVQTEHAACQPPEATPEIGSRCIIGQPNVTRRIWLFGSSTINNIESPDAWTIASQLQARVPDWRIELRHRGSATLLMDVEMMKAQAVRRGDIVVLYGIWNDTLEMYKGDGNRPVAYKLALDMARQWTAERGARLVVVVQPILWSMPLTTFEQKWIDKVLPVWNLAGIDGQRMMQAQRELMALSPGALDLTHVLDRVRDDWPVFHDAWHTSWRANQIIGEAIADAVIGF